VRAEKYRDLAFLRGSCVESPSYLMRLTKFGSGHALATDELVLTRSTSFKTAKLTTIASIASFKSLLAAHILRSRALSRRLADPFKFSVTARLPLSTTRSLRRKRPFSNTIKVNQDVCYRHVQRYTERQRPGPFLRLAITHPKACAGVSPKPDHSERVWDLDRECQQGKAKQTR